MMADMKIIVGAAADGSGHLCLIMQSTNQDGSEMIKDFVEKAMQLDNCAISLQAGEDGERWVGLVVSEEDTSYLHN